MGWARCSFAWGHNSHGIHLCASCWWICRAHVQLASSFHSAIGDLWPGCLYLLVLVLARVHGGRCEKNTFFFMSARYGEAIIHQRLERAQKFPAHGWHWDVHADVSPR